MDSFTENLESFGLAVKTILEALSILLISIGVIFSIIKSLKFKYSSDLNIPLHVDFRYRLGSWLLVSLEFLLAADIVSSVISPTIENLIQLTIIAAVRTFLNYFLGKEVAEGKKEEKEIALEKA